MRETVGSRWFRPAIAGRRLQISQRVIRGSAHRTCPVLDATPRFSLISAPQLVKINVMTEELIDYLLILVPTATTNLDILQVEA